MLIRQVKLIGILLVWITSHSPLQLKCRNTTTVSGYSHILGSTCTFIRFLENSFLQSNLFGARTNESRENCFAFPKNKQTNKPTNQPLPLISHAGSSADVCSLSQSEMCTRHQRRASEGKNRGIIRGYYYDASVSGHPGSQLSHLGLSVSIRVCLAAAACQHFLSATPSG